MCAGRLFDGSEESELSGEVLASSWVENDKLEREAKFWEEAIMLPYYNTVLSILTVI